MADPGYAGEGAPTAKVEMLNYYFDHFFFKKLHENETWFDPGNEDDTSVAPPSLGSANAQCISFRNLKLYSSTERSTHRH